MPLRYTGSMFTPIPTVQHPCGHCRRSKLKCTFTKQQDECDQCIENGYKCRKPGKGTVDAGLFRRSMVKCDQCRSAHETCFPKDRKWPEMCDYCIARGLPCSPPRRKKEYLALYPARTKDAKHTGKSLKGNLPPKKCKETKSKDPKPKMVEHVDQLNDPIHDTICKMEEEFIVVLRTEKEKHRKEIEALEEEHREQLNEQRHRYEARIDDFAKILKKF
ncbi:hypothetical protein GGS26DRAFT_593713 [Hypomontagnella submonticulosa]|nr:hypothetical protein GGS26DRAFT_593713 [Hypomontagnella submonticulosa]